MRGRCAHLPGAEQQHPTAGEIVEDALGERRGGRGHRGGVLPDRRLDAHAPACAQRLAEQPVEHRPRGAGLVRRPQLAQDLAFAGHAGVEPGGDPEQMDADRLVAAGDTGRGTARPCDRPRARTGSRRRAPRHRGHPPGRAPCGCTSRRRPSRIPAARRPRVSRDVERDALAQLDRRTVVGHADQRQHRAAAGGTNATSDAVPRVDEPATIRPCSTETTSFNRGFETNVAPADRRQADANLREIFENLRCFSPSDGVFVAPDDLPPGAGTDPPAAN